MRCAAANRALLRSTWAAWRRHLRNQRLLEAHDGRLQRSAKMLLRVWQTWASARQEMRQALGEEVARMKEELLAVRAHLDATQDELVRVHAVGEQREGSLKLELEQRNGAVRLELDRQKALAAQTIEELSSALETASHSSWQSTATAEAVDLLLLHPNAQCLPSLPCQAQPRRR